MNATEYYGLQQGGSRLKYGGKVDAVVVEVGEAALLPAMGGTVEDEKLTGRPMDAVGADGYMRYAIGFCRATAAACR